MANTSTFNLRHFSWNQALILMVTTYILVALMMLMHTGASQDHRHLMILSSLTTLFWLLSSVVILVNPRGLFWGFLMWTQKVIVIVSKLIPLHKWMWCNSILHVGYDWKAHDICSSQEDMHMNKKNTGVYWRDTGVEIRQLLWPIALKIWWGPAPGGTDLERGYGDVRPWRPPFHASPAARKGPISSKRVSSQDPLWENLEILALQPQFSPKF